MKHQLKKIALLAALLSTFGAATKSATAAPVDAVNAQFTINENAAQPGNPNSQVFQATEIAGRYGEAVTIIDATNFSTSIVFRATSFNGASVNGVPLIYTDLAIRDGYQIYATLTALGTYLTADGTTKFIFTPNSGSGLKVYLDADSKTTFTDFSLATAVNPTYDTHLSPDTLIASGIVLANSSGTLNLGNGGTNAGAFGTQTSFTREGELGNSFFAAPNPFFDVTLTSGDFNNFTTTQGATTFTNGGLSLKFQPFAAVPEPESIALFGIGLLGLGAGLRRRKQA